MTTSRATRLRFHTLGPLTVTGPDGTPVDVGGTRLRALLGLLLVRAGREVPAAVLVDRLWGESRPRDSTAALHNLVFRLRRTLDDPDGAVVVRGHDGYRLAAQAGQVDAVCFEDLLRRAADAGPAERIALLDEALALWKGPAYEGLEDFSDTALEATRLDELRLTAEEDRAAALLESGEAAAVAASLGRFVHDNALRERGRELLLRALYAAGRHTEALEQYRAYRKLLADELGLEPSVALQRLEEQILRHEVSPAIRPQGHAAHEDSPAVGPPSSSMGPAPRAPAPRAHPFADLRVSYLRVDGDRGLAYARVGDGPPLVAVPAWVTSLDVLASGRDLRSSLLERLSRHTALTLYDRCGTGLSPGPVEDFSLEASTAELATVLEHTARERDGAPAALLAVSQAGPIALALAAERPELVSRLVLFGTYADAASTFPPAVREAMPRLLRAHWGLGARTLAELYRPGCSAHAVRHLGRVLQDSAGGREAVGYLEAGYTFDVTWLLPKVRAPALVLHYRGDRVIPFHGGRDLAAALPHARFLPLPGDTHLPDATDLDRIVTAVVDFLTDRSSTS